jgi:hypothetical protein
VLYPSALDSILIHAAFSTSDESNLGLITGVQENTYAYQNAVSFEPKRLLTAGILSVGGNSNDIGGLYGAYQYTKGNSFSSIYNTASIYKPDGAGSYYGGIIGWATQTYLGTIYLSIGDSENRGHLGSESGIMMDSVGGAMGYADMFDELTVTGFKNTGTLSSSADVGGILGFSQTALGSGAMTLDSNTQYGTLKSTGTGSMGLMGGLVGFLNVNRSGAQVQISSNTIYGKYLPEGAIALGGILGQLTNKTNTSITINGNTIASTIDSSAVSHYSGQPVFTGGIVGSYEDISTTGSSTQITLNTIADTVSGITSADQSTSGVGGIIGYAAITSSNAMELVIGQNDIQADIFSSGANASGESNTGGIIGQLEIASDTSGDTRTLTLSENTLSSSVTGEGDNVGGLVGKASLGDGIAVVINDNSGSFSSLSASSGSRLGGLMGSLTPTGSGASSSSVSASSNALSLGSPSANSSVGGLMGDVTLDDGLEFTLGSNSVAFGKLDAQVSGSAGGLVGKVADRRDAASPLRIRLNEISGAGWARAANGNAGGIIGDYIIYGSDSSNVLIADNRITSSVLGTDSCGGVIGFVRNLALGTPTSDWEISSNLIRSSTGDFGITCSGFSGGVIGFAEFSENAHLSITQNQITNYLMIDSGGYAGGIAGKITKGSTIALQQNVFAGGISAGVTAQVIGGVIGHAKDIDNLNVVDNLVSESQSSKSSISGAKFIGGYIGQLDIDSGQNATLRGLMAESISTSGATLVSAVVAVSSGGGTLTYADALWLEDPGIFSGSIGSGGDYHGARSDADLGNTITYSSIYGASFDFSTTWYPPGDSSSPIPRYAHPR